MGRIIKAFFYSLSGLRAAFSTEAAFRQEVFLLIIAVAGVFYIDTSVLEKVLLIGSLLIVLIVELINTALEVLADRVTKEKDPAIKKVKDVASAAVLISLINVLMVLSYIFLF